jgi:hypothetical protein
MDRDDEKKDIPATDEVSEREGDVLGLSGFVPKQPGDPSASHDPESARKRRERMREGEFEDRRDDDPYRQSKGATGIDMGAGGRGTDISGE